MDDSIVFTRWRQCASPCRHINATWRIRLNLCFLQPTWVHNPNGKLISSAVFAQLTAESPYTYNGLFFPPKLPSQWGYLDSHLIHDSLGPPQSSTKTVPRLVQPSLHIQPHSIPILYNGMSLLPSKLPLPMRQSGPYLKPWFHVKIKLFWRILGMHETTYEMKITVAAKIIFSEKTSETK